MSVGIKNEKDLIAAKTRVLANHRLHAVLSMPDELFNPAATVVTCVMVFKSGEKHAGRKTWFGYFKDDGFEKRKHKGRIDARGKWKDVKKKWVDAYHNLDEISGLSVKAEVRAEDEWCAEAYMETDYSNIRDEDFEEVVLEYCAFQLRNKNLHLVKDIISTDHTKVNLDTKSWKSFRYKEIFDIKK